MQYAALFFARPITLSSKIWLCMKIMPSFFFLAKRDDKEGEVILTDIET